MGPRYSMAPLLKKKDPKRDSVLENYSYGCSAVAVDQQGLGWFRVLGFAGIGLRAPLRGSFTGSFKGFLKGFYRKGFRNPFKP